MKTTINNKEYNLEFNSIVGVYYRYEVNFGTGFRDDFNILGTIVASMRLLYSILQNSNPDLDITMDDLLGNLTDEQYVELSHWMTERMTVISQKSKTDEAEEEGEEKNA